MQFCLILYGRTCCCANTMFLIVSNRVRCILSSGTLVTCVNAFDKFEFLQFSSQSDMGYVNIVTGNFFVAPVCADSSINEK